MFLENTGIFGVFLFIFQALGTVKAPERFGKYWSVPDNQYSSLLKPYNQGGMVWTKKKKKKIKDNILHKS